MPKITLTKKRIDAIGYTDGKQIIYWDTDIAGLGLVVGAKTKTFRLQLDVKDTSKPSGYRTVKKTLGRYGADITLEQARDMVRGHVDQDTGAAVLGERLKIKLGDTAGKGDRVLLSQLVEDYFKETKRRDGKDRRERSAALYKAGIESYFADWMMMTLKEVGNIPPATVIEKFRLLSVGAPMSARNNASMLSAVLNYGRAKYPATLTTNPMAILSNRHVNIMPKIKARHECLVYDASKQRNDFAIFYQQIQVFDAPRRDLALFTLYTGMRRAESSTLQWQDVDLRHAELLIKDTKNRKELHIPLNKQALEILKSRKEINDPECPWVFPAVLKKSKSGHAVLDSKYLKETTGLDITIHALRRTFITAGRKLKLHEDTDRLTNHVDGSMSGKHYDETGLEDLREACQMIGNEIERRMLDIKAQVIDISTARQAA